MAKVATVTSFRVDDVIPVVTPIYVEPLSEHVSKRFRRKVLLLPDAQRGVTNAVRGSVSRLGIAPDRLKRLEQEVVTRIHPLIDAVGTAFSEHRPLRLSPDCIWMAIEQGFAHHVTENAEALRERLVRHQGKRELSANLRKLNLESFEGAVSQITSQIQAATDPVLFETLTCDFTTTTPTIRTASEVVLMDCYSSYFEYSIDCVCGIPKITVTGSREDWERIRARVEVLATYDLEWWVGRLRPILDEFVRALSTLAGEEPNLEFWRAIYKPKRAYGTATVTGWIADLFPYLNDPPDRRRNHIFNYVRKDWAVLVENGVPTRNFFMGEPGSEKGVAPASFPCGLSSVPVELRVSDVVSGASNESTTSNGSKALNESRASKINVDLVAGFIGVEQDAGDMSLSPLIGWAVTERAPAEPVLLS